MRRTSWPPGWACPRWPHGWRARSVGPQSTRASTGTRCPAARDRGRASPVRQPIEADCWPILAGILIYRGQAPSVPEHEREWLTPDMGRPTTSTCLRTCQHSKRWSRVATTSPSRRSAALRAARRRTPAMPDSGWRWPRNTQRTWRPLVRPSPCMADEPFAGTFVDAMRLLADAGVAGLERPKPRSVGRLPSAGEQFRRIGARFEAADVQVAAAVDVRPDERSIDGWADEARERFEVVKSAPLAGAPRRGRGDPCGNARPPRRPAPPTTVDTSASLPPAGIRCHRYPHRAT